MSVSWLSIVPNVSATMLVINAYTNCNVLGTNLSFDAFLPLLPLPQGSLASSLVDRWVCDLVLPRPL